MTATTLAWLAVMLVLVAIAVALEVAAHRVRKRNTRKNPGSLGERGRPGSETPDGWRGSGGWDTPSGTRPTSQTARWFRVVRTQSSVSLSACTLPRVGDTLGRETRGAAGWPPAPLSPPTGKMAAGLFLVIETRKPRRSGA
jgi:hypothetical protein